jgi:hypothetical protein
VWLEALVVGGTHRKIQAAHTKLCASRAFMIVAYPSQSHEMLFDAHTRAFTALGGDRQAWHLGNRSCVATSCIHAVVRQHENRRAQGLERQWPGCEHPLFRHLCPVGMTAHYLFDPDFCNVASGWEKGVVEKNVQDARRRIWIEAKTQCFSTFDELNGWLEARCLALWSRIEHPDNAGITVALEQERPYLMPMPTPFDGYIEVLARVSSTCLVTLQRNRYSVSCHLANRKVALHLYPGRIEVASDPAIVARHRRFINTEQVSYDWQHYIPLAEKKPGALRNGAPFAELPLLFAKLQVALRQRERQQGDRIMAKVLAAVPTHGLDAVLAAVEQMLPSGVANAEHVLNVLARLNQAQPPERVETRLKLAEEPLADTFRYDSLHGQEVSHA